MIGEQMDILVDQYSGLDEVRNGRERGYGSMHILLACLPDDTDLRVMDNLGWLIDMGQNWKRTMSS